MAAWKYRTLFVQRDKLNSYGEFFCRNTTSLGIYGVQSNQHPQIFPNGKCRAIVDMAYQYIWNKQSLIR